MTSFSSNTQWYKAIDRDYCKFEGSGFLFLSVFPCLFTGLFVCGASQERETRTVQACRTPRQPLQNRLSGHLGGWATPRSAEEMLDGQHQSGDPCPCQNCSQWSPAEKTGRGSLVNRPSCAPPSPRPPPPSITQSVTKLNWTELTCLCVCMAVLLTVDCYGLALYGGSSGLVILISNICYIPCLCATFILMFSWK